MAFGGKVLRFFIQFFQWIPVVFINTVIVWSYYAYVFILCFESVQSNVEKVVYLIFYHPFFLMLMISYWRTILTDLKAPPSQFSLSLADKDKIENGDNAKEILERFSSKLPTCTRTISGGLVAMSLMLRYLQMVIWLEELRANGIGTVLIDGEEDDEHQ